MSSSGSWAVSVTVSSGSEVPQKMREETSWMYINYDFGFGMKIKFYKKHLDMMITKQYRLTSEADGLIGNCPCLALSYLLVLQANSWESMLKLILTTT